jgi:hypothetical protein
MKPDFGMGAVIISASIGSPAPGAEYVALRVDGCFFRADRPSSTRRLTSEWCASAPASSFRSDDISPAVAHMCDRYLLAADQSAGQVVPHLG